MQHLKLSCVGFMLSYMDLSKNKLSVHSEEGKILKEDKKLDY